MKTESHDIKISEWIDEVSLAGCTVKEIKTVQEIHKKNGDLLFALLDANVISPEGTRLPNIVFIRGHACVIVPLIKNKLTGEERFLMVSQRRIGNGQLSLEFPAGMLDNDTKDPAGVAIRELSEETGLILTREEIFPLSNQKLYSSAGASDEGIYLFGCIKELDDNAYRSLENRTGGNVDENEHITVNLISREDAMKRINSIQAMLGFFLFDTYRTSLAQS